MRILPAILFLTPRSLGTTVSNQQKHTLQNKIFVYHYIFLSLNYVNVSHNLSIQAL